MEIQKKGTEIYIPSEFATMRFITETGKVYIDDFAVDYPGEYEKGGILLEVKEYQGILFYSFTIEGKNIVIIPNDTFEQKEEILSFFGDVDVLFLLWTKKAVKIYENIEARIVVPYGEEKSLFLQTLWQTAVEETRKFTVKEFATDETIFVNLVE